MVKISNFKVLATAFFSLCLVSFLQGQTYKYVSTTGNDGNNGNARTSAYKTIQKALDVATAGTTIRVMAGTYNERLKWKNSGTGDAVTQRIILTNDLADVVTLNGTFTSAQESMIEVSDKQFLTISNIQIKNNVKVNAKGIYVVATETGTTVVKGVTIQNCKISNIGYRAWPAPATPLPTSTDNANGIIVVGRHTVATSAISSLLITGNEIFNCVTGYSEAMTITGNVDGFTVSNNSVHDITNIGIVMAGRYAWANTNILVNKARNGKVEGNSTYRCNSPVATSAGIYVDGGESIVLERNKSYENGVGFSIGCENANHTVTGIIMRDNMVYNNKQSGLFLGSTTAGSKISGASITNNTFFKNYTNTGGGAEISLKTNANSVIRQNIFVPFGDWYQAIGDWAGTTTGLSLGFNLYWRTTGNVNNSTWPFFTSNIAVESPFLTGDPLFVNTTSFDLHIKLGSKAIDAGAATFLAPTGETDIDGAARVQGGRVDIGADELK